MDRQGDGGETDPNRLAEAHLGLVDVVIDHLAARYPRHVDRDELRGAGAVGLVDAAHRYDPEAGVTFAHYAAIRIRGAALDTTRSRDWATRRLRRDLRAIDAATSSLEGRLHRVPDDEEVAAELGIDAATVRERRADAVTSTLLALDRPVGDEAATGGPLGDRVQETDARWLPEPAIERNELVGTLRVAIAHLPDPLRHVLIEHHFVGRLLRDIAEELGVTEARVSQLRYEALHALRAYFGMVFDGAPPVRDDAPGKRRRADFVAEVAATSTWRDRLDGRVPAPGEPAGPACEPVPPALRRAPPVRGRSRPPRAPRP